MDDTTRTGPWPLASGTSCSPSQSFKGTPPCTGSLKWSGPYIFLDRGQGGYRDPAAWGITTVGSRLVSNGFQGQLVGGSPLFVHRVHVVEAGRFGVDPIVPVESGEVAGVVVGFCGVLLLVQLELVPVDHEGLHPPQGGGQACRYRANEGHGLTNSVQKYIPYIQSSVKANTWSQTLKSRALFW